MTDHTDIVESLSEYGAAFDDGPGIFGEAAAEITRLRAEAEALRKNNKQLFDALTMSRSLLELEGYHDDGPSFMVIDSAIDATKGTT